MNYVSVGSGSPENKQLFINDLKIIISSLGLKHIQLHGGEDQQYIDEIKKQLHNEKVMQEIAKTKAELNSVTQDLSSDKKDAKQ